MTGVRTVLIAQVVLIYMQTVETIREKHVIRVDFFMIRIDPSPILFYFYFFIRVDPTRTGGPS